MKSSAHCVAKHYDNTTLRAELSARVSYCNVQSRLCLAAISCVACKVLSGCKMLCLFRFICDYNLRTRSATKKSET